MRGGMRSLFCLLLLFPLAIHTQESEVSEETPEEIEQELQGAEEQFKQAKEMFNPWYSGPLLTGGAHMMPPGYIGLQPYVFVTDNHARYNEDRHSIDIPDLVQLNPQINALQAGVTSWLDLALALQGVVNWQNEKSSGGFGDMNLTAGFKILSEGIYIPAIKIGIGENFPTGRYQKLSLHKLGLDATGSGSYATTLSFRIAKLVLWSTQHPLNLRSTFSYTIPTTVHVKGLNTYGGAIDTGGKVRPGNSFNLSVGMELSFTQKWVFANDFVYLYSNRSKFSGHSSAPVGGPSSDQFSLAPAIEYNPSPNLGILGGLWFSVIGRNSFNFLSGVVSVTYTFNVN